MKVVLIARATLYTVSGGDTIQILNTVSELLKLGADAEVKLSNEKIDYDKYDLLHFFNIFRPADILLHIKKSKKPFVVSPIFVDYSEFDKIWRKGLPGIIFRFLSPDTIEYLKTIARSLVNREKIVSPSYLLRGQKRSIQYILNRTSRLLPNSNNEYKRLFARYGISAPFNVVPNAIDPDLFSSQAPPRPREHNLVLCVGRIEGIKNQLNLIHALNETEFRLLLIGNPAPNQREYYEECKRIAAQNVTFIDRLSQNELVNYYSIARVHVLPSWFETTGLSSLEAGYMGCNIVVTAKGDTKEYFDGYAFYCDPASPPSIYQAVKQAASTPYKNELRTKISANYTWAITAKETLRAYHQVEKIDEHP